MRDMFFNMNQEKMLEISNKFVDGRGRSKVDITDFILLRRIGDFILSSQTISVVKDDDIFHWIHYDTIQESLPIVFSTKLAIRKRVDKLKNLGLLINKKYNVKKTEISEGKFEKAGTYSVVQLSKEVRQLFDDPIKTKANKGYDPLGNKGYDPLGNKGYDPLGNNKEPQESNTKKETTTTNEYINNSIEEQQLESKPKHSSSFFGKILKEKDYRVDKATFDNIKKIKVSEERFSNVVDYCKKNCKDAGFLIGALKHNWVLKEKKEEPAIDDGSARANKRYKETIEKCNKYSTKKEVKFKTREEVIAKFLKQDNVKTIEELPIFSRKALEKILSKIEQKTA